MPQVVLYTEGASSYFTDCINKKANHVIKNFQQIVQLAPYRIQVLVHMPSNTVNIIMANLTVLMLWWWDTFLKLPFSQIGGSSQQYTNPPSLRKMTTTLKLT